MAGSVAERHPFGPKIRRFDHDYTSLIARIQQDARNGDLVFGFGSAQQLPYWSVEKGTWDDDLRGYKTHVFSRLNLICSATDSSGIGKE
jgi:hypothetical protein